MQTHEFCFYETRDMGVLSHAYLCSLMHYGIGCQLPSRLKVWKEELFFGDLFRTTNTQSKNLIVEGLEKNLMDIFFCMY